MAEPIPCPTCGAQFRPKIRRRGQPQRFCSMPCRDASYRTAQPLPASAACAECASTFTPKRNHGTVQKFCSFACRNLSYRRPPHVVTCEQCNVQFVDRWHAASRPRRFCSQQCFGASQASEPKTCESCGGEFRAVGERAETGRFCSVPCFLLSLPAKTERECATCGAGMVLTQSAVLDDRRFCSHRCAGVGRQFNGRPSKLATAAIDLWAASNPGVMYVPELRVGRWSIDLALPVLSLAVELDGIYWHSLPAMIERDRRKDVALAEAGWVVRRVVMGNNDTPECVAKNIAAAVSEQGGTQ